MTSRRTAPAETLLDRFDVPSRPGNERLAIERVLTAVRDRGLSPLQLDRLATAVGEATMNGIEHGNGNRAELPVHVSVLLSGSTVVVSVADHGGGRAAGPAEQPDLAAKLAGQQSPRGWGLFLIRNMVDALDDTVEGDLHTVRLTVRPADPAPEGG